MSAKGGAIWKCTCDCGVVKSVVASHLKSGNTVSCGCYSRSFVGHRVPMAERFWEKVLGEPNSGCWLWMAAVNAQGYGQIGSDKKSGARGLIASRVSWELTNGPIPHGLFVLHKCDTPACVNPAHLFLGTSAQNVADMIAKGRNRPAKGEDSGSSRLTAEQVLEIRNGGEFYKIAARKFGITGEHVHKIRRGQAWAHLPG